VFDEILSLLAYRVMITPKTGFLVSQGTLPLSPTEPDISFMRCEVPGVGALPYIPGSSLKGPFRAHGEALLRSLSHNTNARFACDIGHNSACSQSIDFKRLSGKEKYLKICYACRTYGCLGVASVIRFEDAYPWRVPEEAEAIYKNLEERVMVRNGISVDRNSGKVKEGALFFYESVNLPFYSQIFLKNPEIWQVALFLKTIEHINEGFQKFGHSKSRGMGRVEIVPTELTVYTKGRNGLLFRTSTNNTEGALEKAIEGIDLTDDRWLRKSAVSGDRLKAVNDALLREGIDQLLRQTKQVG